MLHSIFNKKKLLNFFSLFGLFSVIFYLLHDIIGAQFYPGYDFMSQAVSDLTSSDAPSRVIASSLVNVYGTFSIISSMAIVLIIEKKFNKKIRIGIYLFAIMNFISNIGYSLFPLSTSGFSGTFSDIMHMYVVTASVVLLSIISLILITIGGLKEENPTRVLSYFSAVTLLFMLSGPILINIVDSSYFGFFERFSTYSAVMFTGVLGIFGFLLDPAYGAHIVKNG
jgi:hypothetical protein